MDRGFYAAASAGLAQLRKLDLVNNNLANVNTPGFKKQMIVTELQSFDRTLASQLGEKAPFARGDHDRVTGTVQALAVTDFSQGSIKQTGNPLDAALIDPKHFFVVNTDEGPMYTRAGNFTLNGEGQLVTMEGMIAAGGGGEITLDKPNARITNSGAVTADGKAVGNLLVVEIENPEMLERVGGSRFRLPRGLPEPLQVDEPEMEAQALEMSNVTAIASTVDLIRTTRGFELYTKTARTIDEMNQTAISKVGSGR